ncbi:hypothetical protein WJX77_008222 [Trebouxia sp. C0004]
MPRELITIQVGQCGNQIGHRFWELALREHAANNSAGLFDEAMSSFFRNVDCRSNPPRDIPVGDGSAPISNLKARAVLVDMEEGVVNEVRKGRLGGLFDAQQLLTDVSGSGNNWAHGHHLYGPQYRDNLLESIRRPVEACESLQSFLLLQSLGGGTGSGLGCYILNLLEDEFPEAYRFATSVFPSEDDDVITSPYNALLSLAELTEHADAVFPLENQALMDICSLIQTRSGPSATQPASLLSGPTAGKSKGKAFDGMNGIAANMLLHLTSSVRFEGALNVDLNEITTNLVPFPRLHFLLASLSPLAAPKDVGKLLGPPRAVDQVFTEVFSREHQLMKVDPRKSTYLACCLLMRGKMSIADMNRNVTRLKPNLRMVHWNSDGFKLGICSTPPVGVPYSLLGLVNNSCVVTSFRTMQDRFARLYKRKFYLHHYLQYMEEAAFTHAIETVACLNDEYLARTAAAPVCCDMQSTPVGMHFL